VRSSTSTSEILRSLLISTGALAVTALVVEILLRALPVSTATMAGYYFDADVLTYPAHHEWTVSTGWDMRNPQRLHSNNLGFVSRNEFQTDPTAIALVGDSYVEASMLEDGDRPAVQLQSLLGNSRKVYALGSPGTALLDHAQRIRLASRELEVVDFVIWLEPGDARQALCGSGNVHSRCLDPRTLEPRVERWSDPSWVKRVARHSALAQYLFGQLKLDLRKVADVTFRRTVPAEQAKPDRGPASAGNAVGSQPVSARSKKVVDAVLERFFEEIRPYHRGRMIFLVDGHRSAPPIKLSELDLERQYLIERLLARGAEVVDLQSTFVASFAESGLSLEVGPYDRHLNKLGVRVAMTQAAARLQP
jgi:hypothetical protein